jgi:hypothetical protein
MKILLNLGLLSLAVSAMAAGDFTAETNGRTLLERPDGPTRTDSIYFSEDFENGMNGWEFNDLTAMEPVWHRSEFMSLDGNAWWSGSEALEGYDNHWLQYLDTPAINISSSDAVLSFDLHVATEAPGGEPAGYDGWDGCNVWIQVDGADWEVVEGFSVPYNATSLYSFGEEFGMGVGFPGWVDVIDWENVTLDLSDYSGSSVAFRFAFCSDPSYCTNDNPDIYGMLVDNLLLTVDGNVLLDNDADGTAVPSALIGSSGGAAGNTWTMTDADAHSPSYSMNSGTGFGLSNALVSPVYSLPEGVDMWLEFWILSDFLDSDGNDDSSLEDYYYVEISSDGGIVWDLFFYDYTAADRPGSNGEWEDFQPGLPFNNTMDMSLNAYAGMDIQLRFRVTTDWNDDGGVGTGIWIDDVEFWGSDVPANDLACTQIMPAYPRTEGMPTDVFVEFANLGSEDRLQVLAWFEADDEMVGPILPRMDIPGLSMASGVTEWTPEVAGDSELKAYAANAEDQNNANDTLWVSPIEVLPAGEMMFGYSFIDPSLYFSGGDPAMLVTLEDDFETIDFSLTEIMLGLYDPDGAAGGNTIRAHVMNDADGTPGDEIYTEDFTLTTQDALTLWSFPISGDVTISGDFWIWCERLGDYPHALGADYLWNGGHYAITDGIDFDLTFHEEGGNELMFWVKGEGTVGIDDVPAVPSQFELEAAYPNPFNPVTTIAFTTPVGEFASLNVYNVNGQLVSTLFEGESMGRNQVQFDASALSSGVYFSRLTTQSGFTTAQKLVLVK